ncbi:MAG: hypothetical protein A2X35_04190 [Elusimicrobia bacterium GWA2_61_42]|nr:MAG: hypothetical protein A2X35_04190 [Elusimicrobia bacterium GWA2_61_42]OGR74601.1 MAG: hypothetical protein A2X38_05395 [Elusimicrobia bacterium GWC2_61_25]
MAKKKRQRADREKPVKQPRDISGGAAPAGFGQVLGAGQAPEAAQEGGSALKCPALWFSALLLIVLGYFLLGRVDPGGQNAWAIVSPALLLTGYLLIIPAIACTYPKNN